MKTAPRRNGFTLLELLVVMAMLVILGGVVAPNIRSFGRDTKVKAGADLLRGRMADARANAIDDARPYRLSLSVDGTRVRVSPDGFEEGEYQPQGDEQPFVAEDDMPKGATAVPVTEEATPSADGDQWVRLATFLPDGTCREDHAVVEVREPGCYPMVVRLRGLTGVASSTPGTPGGKP